MAPKADNDVFLAVCFRNLKEKPQVNFDEVAAETGMSIGGAKNKFRDIMKKMGLDSKKEDDGEAKPKATPKPKAEAKAKPAKTAAKRKAPAAKDADDNEDQEKSASSDDNHDNNKSETEESPTKKQKTTAAAKKAKAANGNATAHQPIDIPDDASEAENDKPAKATSTRGKKAAPAKPAAKKAAAASKTTKDTSDNEAGEQTKPKPATKAKPRGKAAKKVSKDTTVASDDEEDNATGDDAFDGNEEPATTTTGNQHDKPIPTRTRATSAKPTKPNKVEVSVPAMKGGRVSAKPTQVDAESGDNEEDPDAMKVDSAEVGGHDSDDDGLDGRGQDEV